ncbi:MAG: UvrD-helicase domain-containing protein [Coriobacteriales bacterium]|jgi:ATP-dependent helicase/nuclease subunit A
MAGKFTDKQEECITFTGNRLVISAAAGTGKTFTLTQKIAWMMENGQIDSIDQVLAITFTNKAAGEIKARVRSTLRAHGMYDQALLVDGAWISTIHGMCSRMLKAHAVEAGIDPGFTVIDDFTAGQLLEASIEEALSPDSEKVSREGYDDLFEDFSAVPVPGTFGARSVSDIVETLIRASMMSPDGFDSICTGPAAKTPDVIARELLSVLQDSMEVYSGQDCKLKTFETGVGNRTLLSSALADLVNGNEPISFKSLLKVLEESPSPRPLKAAKYPACEDRFRADCDAYNLACAELCGYRENILIEQAIRLSKEVRALYDSKKADIGALDNDDLLVSAYNMLSNNPQIAEEYRSKFKLVMVDEFQDTSQIQIDIISMLVSESSQLCTVGDAQQSIYRFRGADVNVYDQFVANSDAKTVELGTNFRSHSDVLDFANKIFGQPHVFGKRFLRLVPGRKSEKGGYLGVPRIRLVLNNSRSREVKSPDKSRYQAAAIARAFAEYRDAGASPNDMVLLLGAMTKAQIYSDALAAEGFEVTIAGGSGFWSSRECAMISALLGFLANRNDSAALYLCVSMGPVPTGDDDLLWLLTKPDGTRRDITFGFEKIDDTASPQLRLLKKVICSARKNLEHMSVSDALEQLLADSGYFERLSFDGSRGKAACANVLKALRAISDLESRDLMGVSEISAVFDAKIENGGKDSPGVLNMGSGNSVRIMTIHSSKGLEFPIVGLAELYWLPKASGTIVQTFAGKTYAVLEPGRSLSDAKSIKSAEQDSSKGGFEILPPDRLGTASSYSQFLGSLKKFSDDEELSEARRKFYVGVTRASEALVLSVPVTTLSKGGLRLDPLQDDISSGLFGDEQFPDCDCEFDYGGIDPGDYRYCMLVQDEEGGVVWEGHDDYVLPEVAPSEVPDSIPTACAVRPVVAMSSSVSRAEGLFSYSSISPQHGVAVAPTIRGKIYSGDSDENGLLFSADEDSATELGLAFHSTAEFMANAGYLGNGVGDGSVRDPGADRVSAISRHYELTEGQLGRLSEAVETWVGSSIAKEAATYPNIKAEVPFCMEFPAPDVPNGPHFINGEIDLFCTGRDDGGALIVDYKTGGTDEETPEQLLEKHSLQAKCYAYSVLSSGFYNVRLVFVRVERRQEDFQPQTVTYEFGREDLDEIREQISLELGNSMNSIPNEENTPEE